MQCFYLALFVQPDHRGDQFSLFFPDRTKHQTEKIVKQVKQLYNTSKLPIC